MDDDRLTLAALGFDGTGAFLLEARGEAGKRVRLERAVQFPDWSEVTTLDNPTGTVAFRDPSATNRAVSFYRAETVP
jgi:hypothetical protein